MTAAEKAQRASETPAPQSVTCNEVVRGELTHAQGLLSESIKGRDDWASKVAHFKTYNDKARHEAARRWGSVFLLCAECDTYVEVVMYESANNATHHAFCRN